MAVKKIEELNIHRDVNSTEQFDVQGYLNENWDKMQDVVDNNAKELMQVQKDISTLKEDNKTNKSRIDVLEKSNETRDGKISKNTEDIEAIQGSIKTATETINKKDNEQDEDIKANKESIKEIQAENERLREDIKSIAIQGEANGESIHIEDSSSARCEVEICGNQQQDAREGYNQFKITSTSTQGAGITITKVDGSSVSYQGTTTGMFTHMLVEYDGKGLEITKQMYLKAFGNLTNAILSVKLIKNGKTESSYLRVSPDLILSAGDVLQQIYVQQQNTGILISGTLQVLLTDYENKDKPYEQYGASPSFAYPSSVKAVGDIKNILDMSNAKGGTSGGITCAVNEDGSYSYVGTASSKTINIWLLGSYSNKTSIFRLEPGTYYIDGVMLYDANNPLANPGTTKIFSFINAHDITGVRAPDAVSGNTYDETKYPIIAKIDHEIPWVPYDCGYAKVNIQNKNIAPIFNLGTNWKYTDKGIKNTITSAEKEITKFKLKAGQTIKIGFKLFSKPSQDTTFTWYVNNVSNIISSFGHIDRTTFELNKIYTRTYTAKEECVIRSKMFGNANNDIFEFQVWAEYDNLTEYKKYEEQSYLVDVQQPMLEGDKFVKIDEKWYEKHNFDVISTLNKSNIKVTKSSTSTDTFFRYLLSLNAVNRKEGIGLKIYSTHFINKNSRWARVEGICGWESGTTFCLGTFNAEYDTEEKVTNFLQNTDVKIYYELAEPILLECTEAQSKVLDEIYNTAHTYKNITNISAESAEVNPIINVKYLKDTETEHNKLQAQIDEIKQLLSTTETSALLLDNIQKELESEV